MVAQAGVPHLILDTNAILRYLRNDIIKQADAVRERLILAQAGRLVIEVHPFVVSEAVFVLQSFYKQPPKTIASLLLTFLNTPGIRVPEEKRIRESLVRYANNNVSFVDAFLTTLAAETSHPIFSFDKGLDKFKDIRRVEK